MTNSAIDKNGIEIDVFQWRAIAENKESIQVNLIDPLWEFVKYINDDIAFDNVINISEVLYYRNTPTVYIKVTPWRIINNRLEVLKKGDIQLLIKPTDVPRIFNHPNLLNGNNNLLNRTFSDKMDYLIIYPEKFSSSAQIIENAHSTELNVHKVTIEEIISFTDAYISLDTNYAIREYLDTLDYINSMDFLLLLGDETYLPPIMDATIATNKTSCTSLTVKPSSLVT